MSSIQIPVQLCLADQDQMVTKDETEEVNGWLSNSRIRIIEESKHPLEQTNLTTLSESIRSFIRSLD